MYDLFMIPLSFSLSFPMLMQFLLQNLADICIQSRAGTFFKSLAHLAGDRATLQLSPLKSLSLNGHRSFDCYDQPLSVSVDLVL